jgi:lipopolysaccharide/colanic/teichoic acid biosynthesis glycosyltransferase
MLIFWAHNKKVFFTQDRPRFNQKTFKVLKFRTMNYREDADNKLLAYHL